MKNYNSSPIFIHSLFRSGSTFIFKVFRQSPAGYWCYQEPLNEQLLSAAIEPEKLLEIDKRTQEYLRHPKLEKPYFYEFYQLADKVGATFRKAFSYDQYFSSNNDDIADLKGYFNVLMEGAQGQPVFQCCRSTGRTEQLKIACKGVHIFLWRNPWDQWWSFKKGFDTNNLLIFNAGDLPAFLDSLKKELNIPDFHDTDTFVEYEFFNKRWLGASDSYKIFYALWCYAMLEAEPHCELSIGMDQLSTSNNYRNEIQDKLENLGINGLDFTGCLLPGASYGESDGEFFLKVESYIHGLLLSHGYSHAQVGRLIQMSEDRNAQLVDTNAPENFNVRDGMRVREYLYRAETELAENWRAIKDTQEHVKILEKHVNYLEPIKVQLETKLSQSEHVNVKLEDEIAALQQQNNHWNNTANQLDEELKAVYASKSWRIMLHLRRVIHLMFRLFYKSRQLIKTLILSVMHYVLTQSQLKAIVIKALVKFPRLKSYLNSIALQEGLSVKRAQYSSTIVTEQKNDLTLSPGASRIYMELKQAIEKKGN